MTSSNPTETHLIQHTSSIVAPQWTEVTNVIFCGGPVGAVVATLPKLSSSPSFYRVVLL